MATQDHEDREEIEGTDDEQVEQSTALLEENDQQPREYFIIHEGDSDNEEGAECHLEDALEKGYRIIVIEPARLGNLTIRWIRFGNFLHKSAVLACLGSLAMMPALPCSVSNVTSVPLGLMGVACAGLYDVSWQFDPCSQYQVDYMGTELATVPSLDLHSQTPVVLVRRNDKYRKRLHNTLALLVVGMIGWRLYVYFKSS